MCAKRPDGFPCKCVCKEGGRLPMYVCVLCLMTQKHLLVVTVVIFWLGLTTFVRWDPVGSGGDPVGIPRGSEGDPRTGASKINVRSGGSAEMGGRKINVRSGGSANTEFPFYNIN